MMKIFKVFFGSVFKLMLRFAEKGKVREKKFWVVGVPLVGRHVVKHGLKFEIEALRCGKKLKLKKMFGSWVSP